MNHQKEPASDREPIVLPAWVYVRAFRALSRGYAALSVALGAVLIGGGPDRFSSRGLAVARQVPGQQYTWGLVALAAGAVMLAASLRRVRPALFIGNFALVVWHSFFALTLTVSALNDDKAGLTGCVTYAGWAALGLLLFAAVWSEHGR